MKARRWKLYAENRGDQIKLVGPDLSFDNDVGFEVVEASALERAEVAIRHLREVLKDVDTDDAKHALSATCEYKDD